MKERRANNFWKTYRKSFLKAYLWFILILIGLGLVVFSSWNENKIHSIPPDKPKSISSNILWTNAGSDMATRILYDKGGDLCTLGTFYNLGSEDVLFSKHYLNHTLKSQITWGGSEKDRGLAMDTDSASRSDIPFYDLFLENLNNERLPKRPTINEFEQFIKDPTKQKTNKYTAQALRKIGIFRNMWRTHYIKHVGGFAHYEIEWRIIDFLRNFLENDICTYECSLEQYQKSDGRLSRRRADLVLRRTADFINKIEKKQHIIKIPDGVKEIIIDPSMLSTVKLDDPHITEKINKEGYCSPTRHLITVIYGYDPTSASDLQRIENLKAKYEKDSDGQAQVVTLNELLTFLGIKVVSSFMELDILIHQAVNTFEDQYYDQLSDLADAANANLKALNIPRKIEDFLKWKPLLPVPRSVATLLKYLPKKDL